jgi:hypothetical protein
MVSQQIVCEKSGRVITVTGLSARMLRLRPLNAGAEIYEGNTLVGLNYEDEFSVKVKDIMPIKRHQYKIQKITKVEDQNQLQGPGYYLTIAELNKSSMFIIPLLGYNRNYFRWVTDFMNCFIGTEENGCLDTIYLWYKYTASIDMEEFENNLMSHPNYIKQKDVDKYHVLYEFSVPEKFMGDYQLILEGKYSYISEAAKERILEFHSSSKERPLGKILYRDPIRKEKMEKELGVTIPEGLDLHDPFTLEEEFFMDSYKIPKNIM